MADTNENHEATERRSKMRFALEYELRYKNLRTGESGSGKILNMSSRGVRFTTEGNVRPGDRVHLAIQWPVQLDRKTALKLVLSGVVVRADDSAAAIEIDNHEFRTMGSQALLMRPPLTRGPAGQGNAA